MSTFLDSAEIKVDENKLSYVLHQRSKKSFLLFAFLGKSVLSANQHPNPNRAVVYDTISLILHVVCDFFCLFHP